VHELLVLLAIQRCTAVYADALPENGQALALLQQSSQLFVLRNPNTQLPTTTVTFVACRS
jgi:hypothetical protein